MYFRASFINLIFHAQEGKNYKLHFLFLHNYLTWHLCRALHRMQRVSGQYKHFSIFANICDYVYHIICVNFSNYEIWKATNVIVWTRDINNIMQSRFLSLWNRANSVMTCRYYICWKKWIAFGRFLFQCFKLTN
jgi:hypothetical protein